VWRPAGRGKPTKALKGYTMPQLVDIACGWDATRYGDGCPVTLLPGHNCLCAVTLSARMSSKPMVSSCAWAAMSS